MRTLRAVLALAAACALARSARALDPKRDISQYVHDVWKTEQGLPENSIYSIAQTPDGYLWLRIENGLVRFDGVRFTLFDARTAPGLLGLGKTVVDGEGTLWVKGNGLTRVKDGEFRSITTTNGLLGDNVGPIAEGSDGSVLIATDAGIQRESGGRFTTLVRRSELPALENGTSTVLEDRAGNVWVGSAVGLHRVRGGLVTTYTRKDGLPDEVVRCLGEARDGAVWIGTNHGGLARLKDGAFTTISTKDGLPDDNVSALLEDRDGNLWIGTWSGLARLTAGKLQSFTQKEGLPGSGVIRGLREDREASLWIGTAGGGLNRLRDAKVVTYTSAQGLTHDNTGSVLETRDGAIWISTLAGLSRLKDGVFTSFTTKDGLSSDPIGQLCEDAEGSLWISTQQSGVNRFANGRFTRFGAKDGFRERSASFIVDRAGALWVTAPSGLSRIEGGKRTPFTSKDGLPDSTVLFALLQDREGNLWVGSGHGLYRRKKDGRFEAFAVRELAGGPAAPVLEDSGGALWITSARSLYRLKDGKATRFGIDQGLPNDHPGAVLEDDKGGMWFGSNRGICRIDLEDVEAVSEGRASRVTAVRYGKEDGMADAECNMGCTKSRDGRLWFTSQKGVVVIDPAHLRTNTLRPPVHVEELVADGRVAPRVKGAPLALGPAVERLEIHYTATSLVMPSRVRFKYRLDGSDRDWVDAGTERVAHYMDLPPRDYTFRVKACNDDGLWNEEGASLAFTLLPRFFQTWWFHGLEALASLGALAGVLVLQRRRVQARADHKRKTEELESARRVQLALLPKGPLTVGAFTVAGAMETATEVGGDYYGYLEAGGRLCVVVGDATGHGMTSGLVAGMLKAALASLSRSADRSHGAAVWLEALNAALRTSIAQRGLGICVGIALVDVETGEAELAMAGIPHPFHVSASGSVTRLPLSGTPLGYLKRIVTATATCSLAPGDRLVLITDGLIEQVGVAGEEWGYAGVEAALAVICADEGAPERIADQLLTACEGQGAGQAQSDDRTVVVLERRRAPEAGGA